MTTAIRIFVLWLLTTSSAWSQNLLSCPPAKTEFLAVCERVPTLLGRYLIHVANTSGSINSKLIYSGPTVPKRLALVAFQFLRRATSEDIEKLLLAAPELAQSYIYALRAARDDETDALLAKAASTKIWGSAHRDNYAASYQTMLLLPDDYFRRALAFQSKTEAQKALASTRDPGATRLEMAFMLAWNIYHGVIDLESECSESDFKSQPRRIVWCASLAKRLEANAETALELESALRILRLTAESEAVREHLIAKSKAWQQIESFVMASLGDFSQRRKEFMLKLLTRREPEVLVETYRQLPNSDLALVAIVRSEL